MTKHFYGHVCYSDAKKKLLFLAEDLDEPRDTKFEINLFHDSVIRILNYNTDENISWNPNESRFEYNKIGINLKYNILQHTPKALVLSIGYNDVKLPPIFVISGSKKHSNKS